MTKIGIGFRRPLKSGLWKFRESFDCLEVIAEQFLQFTSFQLQELKALSNSFSIIPHSLRLSIGSVERPPQSYLDSLARLLEILQPPYLSDHFAVTGSSSIDIGHLSPIWYADETLEVVIANINAIQTFLGIPLIFETITHPFNIPHGTMSQEQFIAIACAETGCGILLDLTNIFINAMNFGGEAKAFVERLPKQAIKQFHIIGYEIDPTGFLVDTHSTSIQHDIWKIYDDVLTYCQPEYVIIERDANFPNITELVAEVNRARTSLPKVSA
jgi:uncharacterized protein